MINAIKSLAAFTWRSRMKNAGVVAFAVVALIPTIISLVAVQYSDEAVENPVDFLRTFIVPINVYFTLPFIAIFLSLPTVASLYEKGAIAYIFTRPVPRWACVIGLLVGCIISAIPLLLLAALAPSLVIGIFVPESFGEVIGLGFMQSLLLILSVIPYSALCLLFAIWSRKPLLWVVFFLFVWEIILNSLPGEEQMWSLSNYVMGLAGSMCGTTGKVADGLIAPGESPPNWLSVCVFLGVTAVMLYLAQLAAKKRDVY
jgi:ABC-type transport system involved in multi-copper enzyme maturation permease subunit